MPKIVIELQAARRAAGLNQDELGTRSGLSRKTVNRLETGSIDRRLSQADWPALLKAAPDNMRSAVTEWLEGGVALTQGVVKGKGTPASRKAQPIPVERAGS